jgi:hypothetical protein
LIYEFISAGIKFVGRRTINNVKYNPQMGFLSQVNKAITAITPANTNKGAYGEEIAKKETPAMRANRMVNTTSTICHLLTRLSGGFLMSLILESYVYIFADIENINRAKYDFRILLKQNIGVI